MFHKKKINDNFLSLLTDNNKFFFFLKQERNLNLSLNVFSGIIYFIYSFYF